MTETRGRDATSRHIPPKTALAIGMPSARPPKGWQWSMLTDLARLESGHTPSRRHPEWWGGDIPWIGIRDARGHHGKRIRATEENTNELGIANSAARILPRNTVCLSRTASVGYVVVMDREMATSQDFVNWVCSPKLDHDFLKYLFIAEGDDLLRFASGSVHQTIYFPEVKAFCICHPPPDEQRRIVRVLDEAFEGIATARANAVKNLQNARALFDSHIKSVLGGPQHSWRRATIGESFKVKSGDFLPAKSMVASGDIDVYGGNGVSGKHDQSNLSGDNIIIGRVGAKCGNVHRVEGDVWVTDNALYVSEYIRPFDAGFLTRLLRFQDLRSRANQAAQPVISYATIKDVMLSFPDSLSLQGGIERSLGDLDAETQRLADLYQRKLTALDALNKSILHQAFTGQL